MDTIKLTTGSRAYKLWGHTPGLCLVIETAMASSSAEWWHLAEKWSAKYRVLVYDRAGYGLSEASKQSRTPQHVAEELDELLTRLGINKIILIGHSLGGLYAYQYIKLFPEKVQSIVLLDPVSPANGRFKTELSQPDFRKSGVDKSFNLKIGKWVCSLGLGGLLKPWLKKAPPFYYYEKFSKEAEKYILNHLTRKNMYRSALGEYSCLEDEKLIENLEIIPESIHVPLQLICHTPEIMKKEIEYYGNADHLTAAKIEDLWVEIMKEYLKLHGNSFFMEAKNSGHSIHLTDPETVWKAVETAVSLSKSQ